MIHPPFSEKNLIRVLVVLVVFLALAAGFYHSTLEVYRHRYQRLEIKYQKAQQELQER